MFRNPALEMGVAKNHAYETRLRWTGNTGTGTETYAGYGREFVVSIDGKPDITGSADKMFRGTSSLPNPEDLFLTSISSCHMLSYVALCARQGVNVLSYEDHATGILALDDKWDGKFSQVTLNPVVTVASESMKELAMSLHDEAHRGCFVASSCSVPIHHSATVLVAEHGTEN